MSAPTGGSVVERAHAKVNLHLRILAREAGGYHQLETVFQALELHDTVEATPEGGVSLSVDGSIETGPIDDNLVMRAALAFVDAHGGGGARLRLTKRIPAGAGLGGGSSDAAAALRALDRLRPEPLGTAALLEIGATVGSDVPFHLCGAPRAFAWGRGERLLRLQAPPSRPVLVIDPGFAIATGAAFGWYDEKEAAHGAVPRAFDLDDLRFDWPDASAVNDFEDPVFARHPGLRAVKALLLSTGARAALLSGSGACVFGVFDDDAVAAEAAARVQDSLPAARVLATRSIG